MFVDCVVGDVEPFSSWCFLFVDDQDFLLVFSEVLGGRGAVLDCDCVIEVVCEFFR